MATTEEIRTQLFNVCVTFANDLKMCHCLMFVLSYEHTDLFVRRNLI